MQKIIKIIDENYHEDSITNQIEAASFYSQRNLQRVFKKQFNETLSNYKKRLRLQMAYKKIVYSNDSIIDIAFEVGYETSASFAKAFKNHFKVSPSQSRKSRNETFTNFIEKSDSFSNPIDFEVLFVESKTIHYKMILTLNYNNEAIGNLWNEINRINANCGLYKSFGLIIDQPLISEIDKCRYEACIDVNPNDKKFLTKKIFGGKYIKFIHNGSYDLIEDTYRKIYYHWLFKLDFEIDSSPIIESYIQDSYNSEHEANYVTDILIPIKD